MRISTQNLNERKNDGQSIFWHGRAWFRKSKNYDDFARAEWKFGKLAQGLSAYVTLGSGDDERGTMFHVCLPFIFSVFITLNFGWIRAKGRRLGFAVHNDSFWIYVFDAAMGDIDYKNRKWYQRYYSFNLPWQYDWYSTEVLEHKANLPYLANTLHIEKRGIKRRDAFDVMRESDPIKKAASETYDYTYTLKSGKVQHRKATVYIDRMTWIMRWWPILPFKKVKTYISVSFDAEVGEGTGSWKGGCTGCGYEMRHGESPLDTIRRMESERKFGR